MIHNLVKDRSRLPGVYFSAEDSPPRETLPRMDIAAFVGFAEAGPQNVPVPIEDMDRFREIFGGNLELAWDRETAQMQPVYLSPAVESFFQNGGRRCWIVRAADGAQINRFVVPGVIRSDSLEPEIARARSGGSWSDAHRVGCTLNQKTFLVHQFTFLADENEYVVSLSAAPSQLSSGDLLRLTFSQRVLFLSVGEVISNAYGQEVTCPSTQAYWFRHTYPVSPSPTELQGTAKIHGPDHENSQHDCLVRLPQDQDGEYQIEFTAQPEPPPCYGDILHVTVDDDEQNVLILCVSDVLIHIVQNETPKVSIQVQGSGGLWLDEDANQDPATTLKELGGDSPFADLLTFSLSVWQDLEQIACLGDLGFCKHSNRFWASLPTDEELFRSENGAKAEPNSSEVVEEVISPRFPLAGPENPDSFYIPLGMPFLPDPQHSTATVDDTSTMTRLERNGIMSFESNLFLDEDLKSLGSQRLSAEADQIHYLQPIPRALEGLHSLWGNEEVTLLAIPDAVQRGWQIIQPPLPDLLEAPVLTTEKCKYVENNMEFAETAEAEPKLHQRLSWEPIIRAEGYTLQEAQDPDFSHPITHNLDPVKTVSLPIEDPCPHTYYYRLRAVAGAKRSPWSNTCEITCPEVHFQDPSYSPLPIPELELVEDPQGDYSLRWKLAQVNKINYVLQRAEDPAFITAVDIQKQKLDEWTQEPGNGDPHIVFQLADFSDEITYFRVRALKGEVKSPWSNTIVITHPPGQFWAMVETSDYESDNLLTIQRAMLAFSAARGDTLAVLTMPSHYRHAEAMNHLNRLQASSYSFSATLEERDLSYGALFHPWLVARTTSEAGDQIYQRIPSDGAICGTMAATAINQGAWIAPANISLSEVVSLEPSFNNSERFSMFSHQINTIVNDPSGFISLSADTLSLLRELGLINVRRLLSLLRRLALREGNLFVFESNSDAFRRRVKYHFERFLEDLFLRGAFAGKTPNEAFWVRVDETINPRTSVDEGRLIIELGVAPSQPLQFLIVRLIQREQMGLSVSEG